jgi:outer membrane protein OmpA-like peptidoglycan-associated protein
MRFFSSPSILFAALSLTAVAAVHAADTKYYDPSNVASPKGKTLGYELFTTIGCPGRQLLEGGCPDQDSDGDGVFDREDACPGTPKGRKVDARGCELDSDGDGVVDGADACPGTPKGRKVDARGCELDSDGDGVVDALDRCPDTPRGAKVNATGCELDSDGDGVVDRLDRCPTVAAPGTADGCPRDSDGDGVPDERDRCPTVAAPGTADGCPPPAPAKAAAPAPQRLDGVYFDNNQATLRPDARARLDAIAETLKAWGDVKVEVAGHTDSRASEAHNLALSQRRAEAVREYLIGKGIAAERLIARAYGATQPVADNDSETGRAKNRRVELVPLP